ncbi:TSUP family transporter [Gracilibacillus alcaliphilus]|uniref:TSUP family transporter n=1 Tax=Gracilibacillus alcaliphilus TaxID=1401441 RepID=UPI001956C46F|nr:putative membrane protein YfcA [Gracilibacillus alcaliphilus]
MKIDVSLLLFSGIGILIGVLSSMFGFGGGFIVVPILFLFLPDSIPGDYLMHTAIGTSLAVMIINSFNSTLNHAKQGNVLWPVFKKFVGYIAIGSLIGGILAYFVDSNLLRIAFISMLSYVIISSLFKKTFTKTVDEASFQLPSISSSIAVGSSIGFISTMMGIGGSVMTIPYLRGRNMSMLHAVALATPLGLPIATVGAVTYLITGLQVEAMPASTIGFIYIPAFFGFIIGGFIGVPFGRKWAEKIPDQIYSKMYLILLFIVVVMMILG